MTVNNREKFHQKYQAGKKALERGQYRLSIENLEAAKELVASNSRQGGEAQIWLVTAYQAANQIEQAIALCQELVTHPNTQTREQAQRILYIIKAPVLERPKEWMSEIPDLADAEQGASRYVAAKKKLVQNTPQLEEDLDSSPTDAQDNQFVWFALVLVLVILGSLVWLSRV
ncbi:outer membrane protein assembly factor BamD [Pleurocapsales cyanobacterium LEGE 10410]|nr:outer membrane protein assembly factor BamD [Pleurocapsales cyanobacterium LEGE 10410]